MRLIASIVILPHLLILYCSYYLHFFAIPTIRGILITLPAAAQQSYNTNFFIKVAGYIAEVSDAFFGWWFIFIPVLFIIFELFIYLIKKRDENLAIAGVVLIIMLLSTISFLSMSANMMALLVLSSEFTK